MKRHLPDRALKRTSLWAFFLLVFALSALFWLVDPVAKRFLPEERPINVPVSALMAVCPVIAASVLVGRERGWAGVRELLKRSFDWRRIKEKAWYVPIFLLMPTIMVVQYGLRNPTRLPVPDPRSLATMVVVWLSVFFIAALCEELGWQGYAIDRLQNRWSALAASIVLGTVWATWHIVPLIQLGRTPIQIASQCMDMIATRILIVWIYNNTGRSVFAAALYHAMYNVSTLLLPNYGLDYSPTATSILVVIAAATVTFLWGPKKLARYRTARLGG
ncbi:MAG: lysostaphin resistance A-like protein [Anaerolineae bacterium]|jgi:membrane protease YdiL (CAAX protease family)